MKQETKSHYRLININSADMMGGHFTMTFKRFSIHKGAFSLTVVRYGKGLHRSVIQENKRKKINGLVEVMARVDEAWESPLYACEKDAVLSALDYGQALLK